ncbi:MAG TPA: hypothetical protein VFW31_16935 [Candidatus Angelobacter sp.]|nr:hypothetical protein [Candidatus Angelobacter sp.]
MTIAAGFRCQEDIILCTDNEFTYQTLKLPGQKIFPLNVPNREMNMAFAIAGTVNFARSAFQFIKRNILALPSGTFDEISLQVFLEDQLCQFHEKHIFKHPRYGYTDGPQVFFIVAAQFKNEQRLSLYSTDETTVNPERSCCFSGVGAELAQYIVEPLVGVSPELLQPKHILLLATHMLVQVNKSVGSCGQGSSFFRLGSKGEFRHEFNFPLPDVTEYSDTFQEVMRSFFFAAADLDMDDLHTKAAFRFTDFVIEKIRREQKEERSRRIALARTLFGPSSAKKSNSQKSEDQR